MMSKPLSLSIIVCLIYELLKELNLSIFQVVISFLPTFAVVPVQLTDAVC